MIVYYYDIEKTDLDTLAQIHRDLEDASTEPVVAVPKDINILLDVDEKGLREIITMCEWALDKKEKEKELKDKAKKHFF